MDAMTELAPPTPLPLPLPPPDDDVDEDAATGAFVEAVDRVDVSGICRDKHRKTVNAGNTGTAHHVQLYFCAKFEALNKCTAL